MTSRGKSWQQFRRSENTRGRRPVEARKQMSGRDMAQDLIVKPASRANSTNPKDLLGNAKVSISKLPVIAVAHAAMAMMDGAEKYGPFNWRDKDVRASIYVDAAKRHLDCWFEGQETASDSKVHHLGHAIACCAILLDAQAKGKLVDDRPLDSEDLGFMERQLEQMSIIIKKKRAEAAAVAEKNALGTNNPVSLPLTSFRAQKGRCDDKFCGSTPHYQTADCNNWRPVDAQGTGR